MKLITALSTFFLLIGHLVFSQDIDKQKAYEWIVANKEWIGLEEEDIVNSIVTNAYHSSSSGLDMVYLQQSYKGIPVYNQILSLSFKNGTALSNSGSFIAEMKKKVNVWSVLPAMNATTATEKAIRRKGITQPLTLHATTLLPGRKFDFGTAQIAEQHITTELIWVPIEQTDEVILCWQTTLKLLNSADYWLIRMNAQNGDLISESNLTVYCDWGGNHSHHAHGYDFVLRSRKNKSISSSEVFFPLAVTGASNNLSPQIVNGATYRIVPFPYESPRHYPLQTGLVADPWTYAPGNATSLKWHSTGTSDYNYTRGNNVWAQEDANGNNGTGTSATSTTPDPLTFNFNPNFNLPPTQSIIAPNQQFNVTNLFYWNNIIHDITYRYGFDEVAGNFQSNNQGRGGNGNDYVLADAQDGSGTNNANFSTPADGGSGRMQMFLWNPATTFTVNAPTGIAGSYQAVESNFSTANKLVNIGSVTGNVVIYNDDATGSMHEACVAPTNTLTGKVALIDRGNCNFTIKVKNAQIAGAIAVVMVNNDATAPIIMGGTDNTITIPAIMISQADGLLIKNQLANNVNVTMSSGEYIDGDVDNGVIVHEYSHGISNRLTGGPSQASCLGNAEQMGEGWSDYISLMLTQDWANANVNTGFTSPRGIGTYVFGQTPSQSGIRTQKYCTDFNVNSRVYAASIPSEIHDLGEIWCATLWDMTWNIIQQTNSINADIYDTTSDAGNSIALRLVLEGMKLQPCSPGFIDGRNAIIKADSILYGGAYSCSIREAFRRRGMGVNASQGASSSVTDQVADYTPYITMAKSENISQASEGQQVVYTTVINSCSPISNYTIRDTLPAEVTYVSGGTYDAVNRVVSFPVNLSAAGSQSYSFTVTVNSGTYFAPQTYIDESITSTAVPTTLTATSTTTNTWSVNTTQSVSSPNSLFTPNAAVASDQKLETTNAISLGSGTAAMSFFSKYTTQSGVDGAVVEVSTNNGTTWTDLNNKITLGYYNATLSTGSGNPLAGRRAWSGNSGNFVKTSVNLSSYSGQSIKIRFRFGSSNTVGSTGWYVDDIMIASAPVVNIRSSLFNSGGTRVAYSDTVTQILETVVCNPVAVNAQPTSVNACAGASATFSTTATGTNPVYQWQISTDGGISWSDISGASGPTYTINAVTAAMNNHRFRVTLSNTCPSNATSEPAILTVSNPASFTTQPNDITVCEGLSATFNSTASGTAISYQWQVSNDGGTTWTDISGAGNNSYIISNVTASMSGQKFRVRVTGCNGAITSNQVQLTVSNTASISLQPANAPACAGSNALFAVSATGSSLTYQWQVSTDLGATWSDIFGATSSSLNLTNVTISMNDYRYRVLVSNNCASGVTSSAAILIVSNPASITGNPSNQTLCAGQSVIFAATATGSNITYQWQTSTDGGISWTDISGANGNTYSLSNLTTAQNDHQFRVLVFSCNSTGLQSNAAILSVNATTTIVEQPISGNVCEGSSYTLTANVVGNNLSYQWEVSSDGGNTFSPISGAINNSLTINNLTPAQSGYLYHLIATGDCGGIQVSTNASITITQQAAISQQPTNVSSCIGGTAVFSVTASGPSLTYQWQSSNDGGVTWVNISGANSNAVTISNIASNQNNWLYRVLVGSSCSALPANSSTASLTILAPVAFQQQPSDVSGCAGTIALFTAAVSGSGANYQWQVSTDNGTTWNNLTGETGLTLQVNDIQVSMNQNKYRLVVQALPCGNISNEATLSVLPAPLVTLTAAPHQQLYPGLTTTLTATANPASSLFNWYKNGVLIPAFNGNQLTINYENIGDYTVSSQNGCSNLSNLLTIADSITTQLFLFPNPNNGIFYLQFYGNQPGTKYTMSIFDAKGAKVMHQELAIGNGYQKFEIKAKHLSAGTYMVSLFDSKGNRQFVTKLLIL